MRIAVVVFPGTNCDEETRYVLGARFGHQVDPIWHRETELGGYDCVVLPGGFSYGDHLRAGAIARFSPVMQAVERFAAQGRLVLGICNGFQILAEAGLLPGTLLPNAGRSFLSTWVHCRVESDRTLLTVGIEPGHVLRLPIAHGEGRYVADPATLARVERNGQVVLRYCDAAGQVTDAANPNGSTTGIAGVCNEGGNVLGLMPHPERAADSELPSQDGVPMFEALDRWSRSGRPGVPEVAGVAAVAGSRSA
ncbi:MAG: phosphoribosylformylglycinamidine synthase I [Chloroflexota bacterium]|nr:phosphoribosylformylglycinamidine synthase I [Chloroflexota bacterium]